MSYFVTLYIETMKPKMALIPIKMPHAFLGLTRKHPDELDELIFEKNIEHWDYNLGKMVIFRKEEIKWYEKFESIEYNDGFWGFAPVDEATNHWGKVVENNHFAPKWNNDKQIYEYAQRAKSSFSKDNRCVFEISKEQYKTLLESIKQDVQKTKDRNGNLQQDDSKLTKSIDVLRENLYYNSNPVNSTPHYNCATWALHKLDSIGIEVIDISEWIPDAPIANDLKETFTILRSIHSTFLKFQSIDKNLESIKGAKAFRMWVRELLGTIKSFKQSYCIVNENQVQSNKISSNEKFVMLIDNISFVYLQLDKILQSMLKNIDNKNLKGDFIFVYWDKTARDMKVLDKEHDYQAYTKKEFDLSNPAYNFSVCKFAPFIFIPNDKTLSQRLYHKYDYGNVSSEYKNARNKFYQNVLAGIQSDKYWSSSYHKLTKNLSKNKISKVANA